MSELNDTNPFASPLEVSVPTAPVELEVERVRHEHLSREASIQSVGLLHYIGAIILGVFFALGVVLNVNLLITEGIPGRSVELLFVFGIVAIYGLFSGVGFWVWPSPKLCTSLNERI